VIAGPGSTTGARRAFAPHRSRNDAVQLLSTTDAAKRSGAQP